MFINKKASLADSIYMPMYLLIISSTIFIAYYVWITFAINFAPIAAASPNNSTIVQAINDIQGSMANFDYMFPFLVGGLLIVSLLFAFRTGANVMYAYVSVIFWLLALIMSVIFTNIFGSFAVTFPTVANSFPIISYTMNNMKWISLFWAFLISVVMFTRTKAEDNQLRAMSVGAFQ